MKIYFQDEYGINVDEIDNSPFLPQNGDAVVLGGEEWRVKGRTFYIDNVVVTITQNMVRTSQQTDNGSGRLNEMNAAIINVTKRLDATDKKHRALNEQVVTVRKHINNQIRQEKKDSNETR